MKDNAKKALIVIGIGTALAGIIYFNARSQENHIVAPDVMNMFDLKTMILNAPDNSTLIGYYHQIGGLLTIGQLTIEQYDELYADYVTRFYQLNRIES